MPSASPTSCIAVSCFRTCVLCSQNHCMDAQNSAEGTITVTLLRLKPHHGMYVHTPTPKSPVQGALFFVAARYCLLCKEASQSRAPGLDCFSLHPQRTPSLATTPFWQFSKRPPADHTVGLRTLRGIDWCHPRVAMMLRYGVIRDRRLHAGQRSNLV